jgi:large repetitive protein
VSIVARFLSLSSRFAICITLALAAVVGCSAEAQTAPQLLPYTSELIAGGDPTATFTVGATCPQAGAPNIATDIYGDGCLATEITFGTGTAGPRYAIADDDGNIFISDYTNGLVRRVDAITGIITAVAGGGAALTKGAACGANTSSDILGDGCLGTAVKLGKPAGLAFDVAGDLIFADSFNFNIRKIAATNGFVPATGGIITLVAGDVGGTTSTGGFSSGVNAATSSYVEDVFGISMDKSGSSGNLYYADEYAKAEDVSVINTNATSDTVTGVTVPAGQTVKIAGATAKGGPCINAPTTGFGCTFGTFANNTTALATVTQLDAPYAVANDNNGDIYIANEFQNSVAKVNSAGVLTLFAGTNTGSGSPTLTNTTRALATTVDMGTDFGVAADNNSNVYITDSFLGFVWRVDAATGYMYVVAGGGSGSCANPNALGSPQIYDTADTYGDGCPALQAKLGIGALAKPTNGFNSAGVFGVTLDKYGNLFLGDDVTNIVREIATGAQFGVVGANQPTNTLEIHFGAGDTPATTGAYMLTMGTTNFSLGTATCTYNNADTTTDCLLPVTATPTALGAFMGKLQVSSKLGGIGNFTLSGNYAQSPNTRTSLSYTAGVSCTGTTTYSTTTSITLTATVVANGPTAPIGSGDTITFYANNGNTNAAIGTMPVSNLGTATVPVYGATLNYTFTSSGSYTLTAVYSGDSYFKTSTGQSATTVTIATPSYNVTAISNMQSTVAQGQTALYSFTVNQNVYSGTINFAVTGLPANSSYTMSPTSITATGCSGTSTVTLSILTTPLPPSNVASIGAAGHGPWALLSLFSGLGLALFIGLRRHRMNARLGQLCMMLALLIAASGLMACNTLNVSAPAATPKGTYTITVTASGSAGSSSNVTFPLTVN